MERESTFNETIYEAYRDDPWKFLGPAGGLQPSAAFLLDSPGPVFTCTASYLLFVNFLGPYLMRDRKPLQLKQTIRIYNFVEVILAAYLNYAMTKAAGSFSNLFDCTKTFTFADSSTSQVFNIGGLIIAVRLSEYLDTIFFILRKKNNQVTFLHVFHHAFVPIYAFWIIRTAPTRFNFFILLMNSFVHVLMYFYYLLATFQSRTDGNTEKIGLFQLVVNKLLAFKKYMTQLQILQFVVLGSYSLWAALQPNKCNIPTRYIVSNSLLAFGFLGLFVHFYLTIYKMAPASRRQSKLANGTASNRQKTD